MPTYVQPTHARGQDLQELYCERPRQAAQRPRQRRVRPHLRHVNHKNSYQFTINGQGKFEIGGEFNNQWRYLKGYQGENTSSAINKKGSWNTIKIVCSGNRIRVYVNNKQVVDANDSNFPTGKIGLVIGTTNQGNNLGVYFDDFKVYVP